MKASAISYSAQMIRAKRNGTKTCTRRPVMPQPEEFSVLSGSVKCLRWRGVDMGSLTKDERGSLAEETMVRHCPYGQPGDLLYVKEASWIWCKRLPNGKTKTGRPKYRYVPVGHHVVYCADADRPTDSIDDEPDHGWRYKAARFMPRWASRMTDRITAVRIERLQAISDDEAKAEGAMLVDEVTGCVSLDRRRGSYRLGFQALWESIYGPGSWAANSWVWVIVFDVIQTNINQLSTQAA